MSDLAQSGSSKEEDFADEDTSTEDTETDNVAEGTQKDSQQEETDDDNSDEDDTTEEAAEHTADATSDNISAQEDQDESTNNDGNMSVVASHYNELREIGRKERMKSRILHLRNFNNWLKSQLIDEYLRRIKQDGRMGDPMRVLDMCCGKGGDLLKWEKGSITHLICTDIADVSVDQCRARYADMIARAEKTKFGMKFTAEFFACDATLIRLRERYKDPSLKLNLVSCQFAFHYSFESLSQADCMVRNAAECLQPGGYFIATIPDANEIMRRLRASPTGRSFGNEIYRIEFVCDTNPPPLFGAKYQFHLDGVVDCPEFLVHFPTLVKLCRKHGLMLERKSSFADYYKETVDRGRSLLHRMNGLESILLTNVRNDEQFMHLRNNTPALNSSKPIGTLRRDEWEATTVYLVCAFKKCKNTWDNEGKPVFQFE